MRLDPAATVDWPFRVLLCVSAQARLEVGDRGDANKIENECGRANACEMDVRIRETWKRRSAAEINLAYTTRIRACVGERADCGEDSVADTNGLDRRVGNTGIDRAAMNDEIGRAARRAPRDQGAK